MAGKTPEVERLANGVPATLCGAQKKSEPEPCRAPRADCRKHCGANRRGSGGKVRCSVSPMRNGRCHKHGGASKSGLESGTWKNGRHSKYAAVLTGGDLQHYRASVEDDCRVELIDEIGLQDLLIRHAAQLSFNRDGEPELRKWARENLAELLQGKRKLSESERRRIMDAERMIPAKQVAATIAMMAAIVFEEAEAYPDLRARIARRITERISPVAYGGGNEDSAGEPGVYGAPIFP